MNAIKRRNIVARVMGAENKNDAVMAEAKRAGVSTRTIERWVEAASKTAPDVGQPVLSETVPSPQKPAENKVLDTLLKDEGQSAGGPSGPPNQTELHQAAVDAENFCVEAYAGLRATIGSMLVSIRYSPPLDATSPEVAKMLKIGMAAELALRANAPRLYPILVKYSSGWTPLVLAVGADAFGMIVGLEALAKSKGWKAGPKKTADGTARASVPDEAQYAESLRPKPPPPSPVVTAGAAEPVGSHTIVNAPLPPEADVKEFERINKLFGGRGD